ncbi:Trans-aconitate methyltransferase-like protein [Xylogone sp. PMI_703]|nr:Trans-aconitate methyltransferase-like protein [Xylogone sp. PMI_703]
MATFAKSTFSASGYAAFRPTYPQNLYRTILSYHQGPRNAVIDLGCGHGVVSRALAPSFGQVIGIDPSNVMVDQTQSMTKEVNVTFRSGPAENLDFISDGELDMVVAGQAAHWFDFSKVWPAISRKLRKGGTVAFFGYKDNLLVDYPQATKIYDHFCYGATKDTLGPYWEMPGRGILRDRYRAIVPPECLFGDVRRLEYEPDVKGPNSGSLGERLMFKKVKLGELQEYTRTFSSFHAWQLDNPDRTSRANGGEGDVVDVMFDKMLEVEPEWKKAGENWPDIEVETEWGTAILLARKK